MPKASDLRHNIRFERRQAIDDGYGNQLDEWYALGNRKCKLLPTSTTHGEQVIANRLTATAIWDLTLYSDELTRKIKETDRVVQILPNGTDGLVFNIRFAGDIVGNNRWLLMQLQEGVASG